MQMEFLKNNRRFGFLYGGKPMDECEYRVCVRQTGNELVTQYQFSDGLQVTNIAKKIDSFGAYEWVNWMENTGDRSTSIISELWDAHVVMPLGHEEDYRQEAYIPDANTVTKVYNPKGSDCSEYEFYADVDRCFCGKAVHYLESGQTKTYGSSFGRSSDDQCAPFFNIHKAGQGIFFAVGWSGQWHAEVQRLADAVAFRSGIPGLSFRLLPKEKIRTSSIVVMPYEASVIDSHNLWRRLLKEHYSLIGTKGRAPYAPFCVTVGGGMSTKQILERIDRIRKHHIPYEYLWIDAGWYGIDTEPNFGELDNGDWYRHCGDWRVSPRVHPGGLRDVSKAVHDAGMKFLLWIEPERAIKNTPITLEHPEYFLGLPDDSDPNLVLNLGDDDAWNYAYHLLEEKIEELEIDCYRQDANFYPIYFWDSNDSHGDRKGLTQIKYIMGLYRLWDALLERFAHLCIDNCASGGRRIDIETLRRSVPLWRSDYQCPANFNINGTLSHHLSFPSWIPYSGSGSGNHHQDIYQIRCTYDASLAMASEGAFCETKADIDALIRMTREYLMLRPYFSEDFYPLTEVSAKPDVWTAVQFDRPMEHDGIVQVFRREHSPCTAASFALHAVDSHADYVFTDIDDQSERLISGKELQENGFFVSLDQKRSAKVYRYQKRSVRQ